MTHILTSRGRGPHYIKGDSMYATSVRPQTKFAAALVAAGVVSAASIVGVAENRSLPVLNIDVANASVITDALYGLGDAVNGVASGVALTFDGAFSLPFDAFTAIAIATQNPSLSPNLLSWLVQRYVNPSDAYPYYSYPWAIKVDSIEPLAGLLPYPLGPNTMDNGFVINAVNQIADAINDALSGLPSSVPGVFATDAFWASDIGRTVVAANLAVTAPVWMLYNTAYYLGYLPADLEATFESAIQNPSEIPGLVSNLVYGLLSPSYGLLGYLLGNVAAPLTTLPGPIGELATNIVTAISNGIDGVLSLLPAPISPTPFPSAIQNSAPFAAMSVEVNSLPEASLAVAGGITLPSVDLVEKKVAATDSTLNTPPATPQDTPPAAGDVDPDETPVGDADAPEVKVDKPVTDTMKSGNRVSPGDKFDNQAKGETVKDDGTAASIPGSDEVAAGDTAGPTGPQDSETDGAGASDPSDASGAAA
jgi:hypothetical protein